MSHHIDPITVDSLSMKLYHLETDTLVTVTPELHGYHLVTVSDNSGIVYQCLHDSVMSAIDEAQEHYDALD